MTVENENAPNPEQEVWEAYRANPTNTTAEAIVKLYLPLVRKIAGGFVRKKPAGLDYDDLIQAGNMGLMDAIQKFKIDGGASFKTYASIRIRGSILDEINSMDWTPRSVRKNIKSVIRTIEKHYAEGGTGEPSHEAMMAATELTSEALTKVMGQMNKTYMLNMEPEIFELVAPTVNIEKEELAINISTIVDRILEEPERVYVYLKFYQELDNKDIIKQMHISIKQLHSIRDEAMRKLAEALQDNDDWI